MSLAAATAAGEDPQLSECWLNNQVEEGARLQGNDNGPGSLSSEGVYTVGPGEVGEGDVPGHTRGWGVGKGGQLCPVAKVVDEAESQGQDLGRGVWSVAGTFGAAVSAVYIQGEPQDCSRKEDGEEPECMSVHPEKL